MLYVVAIICFILTAFAYADIEPLAVTDITMKNITMTVLFILGLTFVVAGYSQKPKPTEYPLPTVTSAPTKKTAMSLSSPATSSFKPSIDLLKIRGIGPKRAEELKNAGILTANDLAKAKPTEIAKKTNVSTKITRKWVTRAKKLLEKT
jgi:predicted flap endonuclease-1-like 5' DNA nuclease